MPSTRILLGWVFAHLIVFLIQLGYGSLAGATDQCDTVMCGTSIAGVMDVLTTPPSISLTYVLNVAGDLIGTLWGLYSFNYQFMNATEYGPMWTMIGYILRIAGALGSTVMLMATLGNLLQAFK